MDGCARAEFVGVLRLRAARSAQDDSKTDNRRSFDYALRAPLRMTARTDNRRSFDCASREGPRQAPLRMTALLFEETMAW